MAAPRNILFDLDGTLIDSLPGIAFASNAAFAACGIPMTCPDLKQRIGPPIRTILGQVSGITDQGTLDRLEKAFRAVYDTEGWRKTVPQGDVSGLLHQLAETGATLWVVTNKPALATGMILRELGWNGYFRDVVCRDSRNPRFSSKGEMVSYLMEQHHLHPADCLLVGDTLEDCGAAAEAGIRAAVVPHGYGGGLTTLPQNVLVLHDWDSLVGLFAQSVGL